MELLGTHIVGGRECGRLRTQNGKEILIPILPKEERFHMSQIAMEMLGYPEQLVVSVATSKENGKFSFGIVRLIPVGVGANRYVNLFTTAYIYASRGEAVDALEKTFRLLTNKFFDEGACNSRYQDDGFTMLNNNIVDWFMEKIKQQEELVYVSEYFWDQQQVG